MLFDIRTIVAGLLGSYGVVLIVMGLVDYTADQQAKTGDVNVNLWAGIGMAVVALAFLAWALLRPVRVPPTTDIPKSDEDSVE
ncbi:hypothetical protein [Nocardia bovistercoris]|uniref:Uncharacterized protein n=1 Tax=Nocardia bovistercoris TaxID=2785916 RepID=A0A931N2L1_9NOCA|nr:hypothetical protein [Nocardia bovistercoris]MBH0775628.1 hypothetical protein [Nocardia bovistercoris]